MDDNGLEEMIRQGDIKAFETVFKRFYKPLCNYAFRFVHDADMAGQLVQDVFFHIWEKREHFKVTTNIQAYLLFSVRNECLKHIRHNKVEQRYAEQLLNNPVEPLFEEHDTFALSELSRIIELTLQSLPERTREIFMMSRFRKLRYSEIAFKLGISVKTVESNMGKALKAFRETLSDLKD
jgi:RNA polymerase sigma-70 factor (ECF subfamily)